MWSFKIFVHENIMLDYIRIKNIILREGEKMIDFVENFLKMIDFVENFLKIIIIWKIIYVDQQNLFYKSYFI